MIRTQMVMHSRSEMVSVLGTHCVIHSVTETASTTIPCSLEAIIFQGRNRKVEI
jgi:hypothetical protein